MQKNSNSQRKIVVEETAAEEEKIASYLAEENSWEKNKIEKTGLEFIF